jgi:hypothetical protein
VPSARKLIDPAASATPSLFDWGRGGAGCVGVTMIDGRRRAAQRADSTTLKE